MTTKLAKALELGDEVVLSQGMEARVVSKVESVQVLRRTVLLVTLERDDGRIVHRTFQPNSPMVVKHQHREAS